MRGERKETGFPPGQEISCGSAASALLWNSGNGQKKTLTSARISVGVNTTSRRRIHAVVPAGRLIAVVGWNDG